MLLRKNNQSNHKSKGQGLVEFALILPILLLLLLGIFEFGRVIWAYITVQTAAREAARYAITGQPYAGGAYDSEDCKKPEGDGTNATIPWTCNPELRAEAIKNVARSRGANLAGGISNSGIFAEGGMFECRGSPPPADPYNFDLSWTCDDQPGYFGVQVIGQTIDPNVTGSLTQTVALADHAGDEGLNVLVHTYYNVEMVTPIFDALMGGTPLTVRGEVQMQNEGLNPALGSVPPAQIQTTAGGTPLGGSPCRPPLCGSEGQRIESVQGTGPFCPDQAIPIQLIGHPQSDDYDIYLETANVPAGEPVQQKLICQGVRTNNNLQALETCDLNEAGLVPGDYCLYSVTTGATNHGCNVNPVARYSNNLIVNDCSSDPRLFMTDGGLNNTDDDGVQIWAARTQLGVELISHDPNETFDVQFDGATIEQNVATNGDGFGEFSWRVPFKLGDSYDDSFGVSMPATLPGCTVASGSPCVLESLLASDSSSITTTRFYVTEPVLNLINRPANGCYRLGQTVQYELQDHTPTRSYEVYVRQFLTQTNTFSDTQSPFPLRQVASVNSQGDSQIYGIRIPAGASAWPVGGYQIGSYQQIGGDIGDRWISERTLDTVFSICSDATDEPYILITDGNQENYEWPIGSIINIELYNHDSSDEYYLQFTRVDGNPINQRVPIAGSADDTFVVRANGGRYATEFEIPLNAAVGGSVTYRVCSYRNSVTNPRCEGGNDAVPNSELPPNGTAPDAAVTLEVLPEPLIQVYNLDGERVDDPSPPPAGPAQSVLPDDTITISLTNHSPRTNYHIFYASKDIFGGATIQTNAQGEWSGRYDLDDLPKSPGPDLTQPEFWIREGYIMASRDTGTFQREVATTTLRLQPPDLRAVQLVPSKSAMTQNDINEPLLLTFRIANTSALAVEQYFDIDYYYNPDPLVPQFDPSRDVSPSASGLNFPGDYKIWQNQILAGQTIELPPQTFTPTSYGRNIFYAYVDTSNFVDEIEERTNNVISATVELICTAPPINPQPLTIYDPAQRGALVDVSIPTSQDWNLANWLQLEHRNSLIGDVEIVSNQLVFEHVGGNAHRAGQDQHASLLYVNPDRPDGAIDYLRYAQATLTQLEAFPDETEYLENAMVGVELRTQTTEFEGGDALERLYFGMRWVTAKGKFQLWAGTRPYGGGYNDVQILQGKNNDDIGLNELPVTFRIERVGNSNTFTFKYGKQGNAPTRVADFDQGSQLTFPLREANPPLYAALFATNNPDNNPSPGWNSNDLSEAVFSNFAYGYEPEVVTRLTRWEEIEFGTDTEVNQVDVLGDYQLRVTSKGLGSLEKANDDATGYYFIQYVNDKADPIVIPTAFGFDTSLVVNEVSAVNDIPAESFAGLELRNDAGGGNLSAKIQFGLLRNDAGEYNPAVYYRPDDFQLNQRLMVISDTVATGGTFRITREDQTDLDTQIFHFFYNGQELSPTLTIDKNVFANVQVGLFNSPRNNESQTAEFGRLSISYKPCNVGSSFSNGQVDPFTGVGVPTDPPPGLELCPNATIESSFEELGVWRQRSGAIRARGSANSGAFKMAGPTYEGDNPYFFQPVRLGDWIISDTTKLYIDYYRNINDLRNEGVGGDPAAAIEPDDIFKVALVTEPPSQIDLLGTPDSDTLFTIPQEVANGAQMSRPFYDPTDWENRRLELPLAAGRSIENYNGETLYLLFYNDSNGENCVRNDDCYRTEFYFDDVRLETCTTQPRPTAFTTHIQGSVRPFGSVTLRNNGMGMTVWAYREGDDTLYKTTTIQGGLFDFYNLPLGTYFLYAEYVRDTNPVDVLSGSARAIVTNNQREQQGINLFLSTIDIP